MKPTHIIVHCSASTWGTVLDIDQWHRARGWSGCGYHAVVLNGYVTSEDATHLRRDWLYDGQLQAGRSLDMDAELEPQEIGAHAAGWNNRSIAVCLIGPGKGPDPFTPAQLTSLLRLIRGWMTRYNIPVSHVLGHNEIPGVTKACPVIDMNWVRDRLPA